MSDQSAPAPLDENHEAAGRQPVVLLLGAANSIHTRRWATTLAEQGHRVVVASWVSADPIPGVDLRVADGAGRVRASRGRAVWGLLTTGWWLRRQLRQVRPDVVHVHSVGTAGLLSLVLPSGTVRVVTPWGSELRTAARSRLRRWVARRVLRGANLVVPTSASVTEEVTGRYRVPAARTATLSWGVDDALIGSRDQVRPSAVRREFGIPEQATVVLSVRSATTVYRVDEILAAFASAARERADLHLVVLSGLRPAEASALRSQQECLARIQVLAAALPGRVTVVDRTLQPAQVFALMCASEVAVSVPRWDQRSTTVLEAALAGCRLFLADLPPYRELLADGLVAELVPEPIDTGLAARLVAAGRLGDAEQRRNRAFIEQTESWSRQVATMRQWYGALVGTGEGPNVPHR
ncbi:glycosyltransferase family 4 protein [Micromonospora sp. CPCC 206060]|uniref:glycosyltransferase family 4 protein n=1 Tax=Micromonospora sp. CPCC 206060 TaxID=3122406 RepID=UPI002FF0D327